MEMAGNGRGLWRRWWMAEDGREMRGRGWMVVDGRAPWRTAGDYMSDVS